MVDIDAPASVVFLVMTVVLTAVGQLFFRMRYVRDRVGYLWAALGCFGSIPLFTYLALLNLPITVVYLSASASQVLILVLSRTILHERVSARHKLAAGLIIGGIAVFNT